MYVATYVGKNKYVYNSQVLQIPKSLFVTTRAFLVAIIRHTVTHMHTHNTHMHYVF